MQNRKEFTRELYEFFVKNDISIETNIVNKLIFKIVGVDAELKNNRCGIELMSYDTSATDFQFSTYDMMMPDYLKFATYFNISLDQYKSGESFSLTSDYALNTLLPLIKAEFFKLDPSDVISYQIESQKHLESSASTTITEYSKKALALLCPANTVIDITANGFGELTQIFLALKETVKNLSDIPGLYGAIEGFGKKLQTAVLALNATTPNHALIPIINQIIEGINQFNHYHRYKSVIANNTFITECQEYFQKNYRILTSECHVIEETLLHLAGATLGKNGQCESDKGSDGSRFVFSFTDIDQENTAKLISFFQQMGDKTAIEGRGYRTYSHANPEIVNKSMAAAFSMNMNKSLHGKRTLERHSIEIDGAFLYNVLFPLLKTTVKQFETSAQERLIGYQKDSEPALSMIEEKNQMDTTNDTNSSAGFFAKKFKVAATDDVSKSKSLSLSS